MQSHYNYNEHKCNLIKNNKRTSLLKPLHPGANCCQKFARKLKILILLDLEDSRCKKLFVHPSIRRGMLKKHAESDYSYIIHPFSKFSYYIDRIFFLMLCHRCIVDIMKTFMPKEIVYTCYVRDTIHCAIMVSFFFTGYVDYNTLEVHIRQSEVSSHYFKTYFLVDLYLATDGYYWLLGLTPLEISCTIISKVLHIVRLRSVSSVIENTLISIGIGKLFTFIFIHLLAILFFLHIFAELLYWVPTQIYEYSHYHPNNSWIHKENLSFTKFTWETYLKSYLIVTSYFLGAGYDDFIVNPFEQLLVAVLTFSGRFYILLVIGKVLALYGHSDESQSNYENHLYQLYSYMRTMNVPKPVQSKIIERLKYSYQKKFFDEQELLSLFTDQIKTEIFLYGARRLINNNAILGCLPKHELAKLFVYMKSQTFNPGEIIERCDKQQYVFFISSGMVACYTEDGIEFLHLNDGDVFGILSIHGIVHNVIYVAAEMTELYYLDFKYLKLAFVDKTEYYRYLNDIKKERTKILKEAIELSKSGNWLISDLKSGTLLEKPKRRLLIE